MGAPKTQPSKASVKKFLDSVDESRRRDCHIVAELMESLTGSPPIMWGSSIVGFGNYHYQYASGREGDWFITGFSPRKQYLTLYIISGFENCDSLMDQLGTFKTGKSCLYIKSLDQVDMAVLKKLITQSVTYIRQKYGSS